MRKELIGLAAAGIILMGQGCPGAGQPAAPAGPAQPAAPAAPSAGEPFGDRAVVEITADGFQPAELRVKPNTQVTFLNKDSAKHWPASAVHPVHKVCPGFDAKKALATNDSYSFVFNEKKECPYHDHLNPAGAKGKIIVE